MHLINKLVARATGDLSDGPEIIDGARIGSSRSGLRTTICEELQLQVGITRMFIIPFFLTVVVCMLLFPPDID
jgi:hypothetical protein